MLTLTETLNALRTHPFGASLIRTADAGKANANADADDVLTFNQRLATLIAVKPCGLLGVSVPQAIEWIQEAEGGNAEQIRRWTDADPVKYLVLSDTRNAYIFRVRTADYRCYRWKDYREKAKVIQIRRRYLTVDEQRSDKPINTRYHLLELGINYTSAQPEWWCDIQSVDRYGNNTCRVSVSRYRKAWQYIRQDCADP
jgi:hypothetical protein